MFAFAGYSRVLLIFHIAEPSFNVVHNFFLSTFLFYSSFFSHRKINKFENELTPVTYYCTGRGKMEDERQRTHFVTLIPSKTFTSFTCSLLLLNLQSFVELFSFFLFSFYYIFFSSSCRIAIVPLIH